MRARFLDWLACPDCRSDIAIASVSRSSRSGEEDEEVVVDGELRCTGCARGFPVRNHVPVFVDTTDYVESFGWQWSKWNDLQRDSYNGTRMVRNTILRRSGWSPDHLRDKAVVECGCGSGNDAEVLADMARTLVSFDLSQAVHSFRQDLRERENVLVMQADMLKIPLKEERFDVVFCHRVIHHTPDPARSFRSIAKHVRPGGELFLECYSRHWKSMLNFKYLWRPLTTRLPHAVVYRTLRIFGPILYAVHAVLHRIAFLRRVNRVVIPFEYLSRQLVKEGTTLGFRERYEFSFLVTFDALTPKHDNPQHPETIREWCREQGFEDIETRSLNPVITTCRRPERPAELRPQGAAAAPAASNGAVSRERGSDASATIS